MSGRLGILPGVPPRRALRHLRPVPARDQLRAVRRVVAVVVAGLIGAVLTGCLEAEIRIDVRDDGTATVAFDVYPDANALKMAGGAKTLDLYVEAAEQSPSGLTVERISRVSGPGLRFRLDEPVPVTQLAEPIRGPGLPVESLQWFRRFDLGRLEDGWRLDAEVAPVGAQLAGVLPVGPERLEALGAVEAALSITLPGRVVSTNADRFDGSTATWDLNVLATEPVALSMVTGPGPPVDRALLIAAGAALAVVVGALLAVSAGNATARRRIRRTPATPPPSAWAPPPGPAAGSPTAGPASAPSGATPMGLYSEVSGDRTVALPVGGAAWGPAPPAQSPGPTPDAPPPGAAGGAPPAPHSLTEPVTGPGAAGRAPGPSVPAGWYPDPDHPGALRFWDGVAWTDHRSAPPR